MTYQQGGEFACDECPESIKTDEGDFREAWTEAQAVGWRSFKGPDGKWAHACPACVEKFAARRP